MEKVVGDLVRTTSLDNVAVVTNAMGLSRGMIVMDNLELLDNIPMGHKLALRDLPTGSPVIRYGQTIGFTTEDVEKGSWINERNLQVPEAPDLKSIGLCSNKSLELKPLSGYTFQGYRNSDGTVGTKNVLGITISVQCVAGMTNFITRKIKEELLPLYPNVDDVVTFNHNYGCGIAIDVPAAMIPIRTIKHISQNPNFGDEVMIVGLGCEKLRPERLLSNKDDSKDSIVYLQDESFVGFNQMVAGIMETADYHLKKLDQRRRVTCDASDLVIGMQCGGSDALSGLTGNPAAGFAADLIVRAGGTVMFSEVTEVRDAAHLLVERAIDEGVGQKLIDQMSWYDAYLKKGGADRSANTTPGNTRGGLSNIVEKCLGSIAKSGSSPIVDVVAPGDKVVRKGLNFVATPASDFVCGTLQLAAGMNMHVFITGRGTPYGLAMVPVIKVSSNSKLSNRWFDLIDIDAGPIATGAKTIEDLGWELFHMILEVASGNKEVATDKLGLYNDLVLFNPGPLT